MRANCSINRQKFTLTKTQATAQVLEKKDGKKKIRKTKTDGPSIFDKCECRYQPYPAAAIVETKDSTTAVMQAKIAGNSSQ